MGIHHPTIGIKTQVFTVGCLANICQKSIVHENILGCFTIQEYPIAINVRTIELVKSYSKLVITHLLGRVAFVVILRSLYCSRITLKRSSIFVHVARTTACVMSLDVTLVACDMWVKLSISPSKKIYFLSRSLQKRASLSLLI